MANILEKIKLEEHNYQTIRLWPEGAFYKAYEHSAYLFVTRLRPYEIRRCYVDAARQDVVSTGFPQAVLSDLGVPSEVTDGGVVSIRLKDGLDEQQYLAWRDALPLAGRQTRKRAGTKPPAPAIAREEDDRAPVPALPTAEQTVAERLRRLDLAATTPMRCMMLLAELQRILRQDER
ncbi:MAG: hypothetical protein IJT19_05405 [Bacteroidaceae bacterium]|nr:hypothetical protein [Bacteroidaceae bacterium]